VKHTGYNFEHFQLSTDARKRAVLDMTVEIAHGVDSPTRTLTLQPGIAFKPMASMFAQLSPTIQRDEDAAQYVTTVPFIASGAYSSFRELAAPRAVKKLVYGEDVGTIARAPAGQGSGASYTVDPDGAGPAAAFSFADPDFTTRSLRGSAVLRWEYRPGSTVYFVWTQQRAEFDAAGAFDFGSAATAIFRDRPVNLFQVKVNYWIGR
jgi:hypothetical protein